MAENPQDRDDVEAGAEPDVLGAAATVPLRRETRPPRGRHRGAGAARGAPRAAPSTKSHDGSVREYSDVVYVFEPHSKSFPPLGAYLAALWERRRFMHALARSGVNQSRSNTALGSLWGILDPLFQAAIYYLLFTIIREGSRPIDFLHVLILDIQLFSLTTSAMTEGGSSVRNSKALMLNSTFPRAMLPLTSVYKGLLGFAPAAGVYVFIHLFLNAPVGWFLLLLPALFAIQVVLNVGLALCTSTLIVFFQDTRNALSYLTRLLFFTTPIIFPLSVLPENIRSFLIWQPLFAIFSCYQTVLGGEWPSLALIGQAAGWAAAFLVLGTWIFLRHERDFARRII